MNRPRDRRPLVFLLIADGISETGNLLTLLAIPWFVLETTGSATRTGIVMAAGVLPIVIMGLLGGALIDRVGFRRMSIASDLASGVCVALIPLLHSTIGLEFWQLLVLVFSGSLLDSPGQTARAALFPDLAVRGDVSFERANTWAQIVRRISGIAGPIGAGVLIGLLGPSDVLWLDTASFLISAGIILFTGRDAAPTPRAEASHSYIADIVEGWSVIKRSSAVTWLIVTGAVGNLLAEPVYLVLLPLIANQFYGSPEALGLMFASLAGGSVVGNLLFLAAAPRLPRRGTLLSGYAVRALSFAVLPFEPPVWVVCAAITLNAIALEPANPIIQTVIQERVPATARGRVLGVWRAIGSSLRAVAFWLMERSLAPSSCSLLSQSSLPVTLRSRWRPGSRPA